MPRPEPADTPLPEIVGSSPAMRRVYRDLRRAAPTRGAGGGEGGRPVPRGPLLPPQRGADPAAAVARPPGGHPAPGPVLPAALLRPRGPAGRAGAAGGAAETADRLRLAGQR